jgi:hypothetical protein
LPPAPPLQAGSPRRFYWRRHSKTHAQNPPALKSAAARPGLSLKAEGRWATLPMF